MRCDHSISRTGILPVHCGAKVTACFESIDYEDGDPILRARDSEGPIRFFWCEEHRPSVFSLFRELTSEELTVLEVMES